MKKTGETGCGLTQGGELCRLAEQRLRERARPVEGMSEPDVRALVQELQVHQIELEMQNEELLRAQAAAQEASEKYADLFDFAPIGYFLWDERSTICEVNLAGAALLGLNRSAAVGKRFGQFVALKDRPRFAEFCKRLILEGTRLTYEVQLEQGELVELPTKVVLIDAIATPDFPGEVREKKLCRAAVIDITARKQAEEERRRLEERIQESERLESLGVLAGDIAHKYNNLLTSVLGFAELARAGLPEGSPIAEYLEQIEKAAQAGAGLSPQVLAYAGKGLRVISQVDLNALVRETIALIQVPGFAQAKLSLQLATGLPSIEADSFQIQQVVLNLVMNAFEALDKAVGCITVATDRFQVTHDDLATARFRGEADEGEYVGLEVADTGHGMDTATQARIFEPFFTTKFTGRGLGLAAVMGTVRSHRGILCLKSAPGCGSSFRVLFPVSRAIVGANAWPPPKNPVGERP